MTPVGKFQPSLVPLLVPVSGLTADPENARIHGDENMDAIRASLSTFGQATPIVWWSDRQGRRIVIKGNGTFRAATELGWSHIAAVEFEGTEVYARAYAIADNRTAELAEWDSSRLALQMEAISAQWDAPSVEWKPEVVGWSAESLEEVAPPKKREPSAAEEPAPFVDVDFVEIVEEASLGPDRDTVQTGDVFELTGPSGVTHRIMCGDSTKPKDVETLIGDEEIDLGHADPPYGFRKATVENDDLRGGKLDRFQVAWWNACAYKLKKDRASLYIWGMAPDLWRLWYLYLAPDVANAVDPAANAVALKASIRNEIVWDKGSQPGMSSDEMRSFAPSTERALFIMIGEQDLNIDADQYWEGWEPLRAALADEVAKAEWSEKEIAKLAGVTGRMASHWFGKSQWCMIPEERYAALQEAGREFDAFQYPYAAIRGVYEELKARFDTEVRETFYASRAFFDNTHDNMTEVWNFPRVVGEERYGHDTPKPVLMIARAIKSSCPPGGLVYEPFAGSGSTLIAAEETGRRCYTMEIQPRFVATTIKRWEAKTGALAVRVVGDRTAFAAGGEA